VLLLYTDGVTDASGLAGMFGEARMLDTLRDNRNKPAHEIQRVLTERLRDFSGSTPQFDDITLMVVTRTLEQVSELAAD
jgi:phosphoserine phosphatase RsbU/P